MSAFALSFAVRSATPCRVGRITAGRSRTPRRTVVAISARRQLQSAAPDDETLDRRSAVAAAVVTLLTVPSRVLAYEEEAASDGDGGGMLLKAGKLGGILLLADVITGLVLGKSAFDFFSKKEGRGEGSWKEKLVDKIMAGDGGGKEPPSFPIQKSQEEWKAELSPEQYRVLRLKGTERPMTGEYDAFYPSEGFFKCAGCGNPLYSAASKFSSGCGWPAFDKCYEGSIMTETDSSMGMRRVEIMCAQCGGHLGHVFEGERMTPTSERHCVNSASVRFDKGQQEAPEAKVL